MTWDIEADVVVVGFGAAGACAALEAARSGRDVRGPRPVPRRRRHRPVRRRGLRRGRHAAAAGCGCARLTGGDVRLPAAPRSATPSQQRPSGRSATAARPCSPGWRAMGSRSRAASARTRPPTPRTGTISTTPAASCRSPRRSARRRAGTGPRPRTSGGLLYRPAGAAVGRSGAQVSADHAQRLITDPAGRVSRRRVQHPAPRLARVAHRVLHRWSATLQVYLPKLGRAMHRPVTWLEHGTGARCGWAPAAAWCSRRADSSPTGR